MTGAPSGGGRGVSYGTGLAVSGFVLAPLGIVLMATAVGLGFGWSASGEPVLNRVVLPVGILGWASAQVGTGLGLGAMLRVIRSCRANRISPRVGAFITGWIFWGLTLSSAAVLSGLESVYNLLDGPYFIGPMVLSSITLFIVAAGWSGGRDHLRRELTRRQESSSSSFGIMPTFAGVPGGGTIGITGWF